MQKPFTSLRDYFVLIAVTWQVAACVSESFIDEEISETSWEIRHDDHDYLFVRTPKPWAEARTICQLQGYDLVTVNKAAEETWLDGRQGALGGGEWWIGYNDIGIENTWSWANGSLSSYNNWRIGEPGATGSSEDCAVDGIAGQWADTDCSRSIPFICERSTVPTSNDGAFTYSRSNTNSAQQNTRNQSVFLYSGMLFTVGTCGVTGASDNDTDTYLRVADPAGNEIAANDDACSGLGSNLSIVVPVSGTYTVRAGCFDSLSCSGTVAYTF